MSQHWAAIIVLGLAASVMPVIFGIEIVILGSEGGMKKSVGLLTGITLARITIAVLAALVLAGVAVALYDRWNNFSSLARQVADELGKRVAGGEFILTDMLLVLAGAVLLFTGFRHLRPPEQDQVTPDTNDATAGRAGFSGTILTGIILTITNVNQWIFISAGVGHILEMENSVSGKVLALTVFLIAASLLLFAPIAVVWLRPERGAALLVKINGWVHGSMRYAIAVLVMGVGLLFLVNGGQGLVGFLNH